MIRFVKKLFGGHKAPAACNRKRMTVRLQVEGLEERSLMAAGLGLTAIIDQPAPAAALASSVPTNPANYTSDYVFKIGNYWINVPQGYDWTHQTPTELFVWSHGCGGQSQWDIYNVAATPGGPTYIAITVDGREGGCWNMSTDTQKIVDAITDVKTHFNIDPRQVVLGGYSSGGDLSYNVAFTHSTEIAGVLAENTAPFRDAGLSQQQALAAPGHFHVVHLAHTEDWTYPIDLVRSETAALEAAGFPVELIERPGTHWDNDNGNTGTVHDLKTLLLPYLGRGWTSPGGTQGQSGAARVDFAKTADWGTGFTGKITITNNGTTAINGWTLEFDFPGNITETWSGQIVSHVGNRYAIRNADWNGTIAPGQSVSFGFNADWGAQRADPTGYALNGQAIGPSQASVAFAVRTDWGNGFTGDLTIRNNGTTAINNWTLEFDFTGTINQSWGFEVVNRVGNHYTVRGKDWGASIAPGQSLTVGFNATWGNPHTVPSGYVLNGQAVEPSKASAAFAIRTDWGTGFTGDVTIRNNDATAIDGWTLEFDFAGDIYEMWSGQIVSRVGNRYTVKSASWNAAIAAGQSVSFGFNAVWGAIHAAPTNFRLNGVAIS